MMRRVGRDGGAALLTAMLVMLALTIIAMSAAQMALGAEKSARNERDRHLAFEAAEAGLL
ncbi:MAG: Pilus assembly protein PilY, partial [Massilia sp.]|nr:Pilus assembly protein PilY [Massilia sp.]